MRAWRVLVDLPTTPPMSSAPAESAFQRLTGTWTFLTHHAHVLLCLVAEPDARLRDVADQVGITERAVQHIVSDLAAAGVIERTREGRRNRYTLHPELPLRHPVEAHRHVADLMALAPARLGTSERAGERTADRTAERTAERTPARGAERRRGQPSPASEPA